MRSGKLTYDLRSGWLLLVLIMLAGCKKQSTDHADPYSGGKEPLDLTFNNASAPSPASGVAGTLVTFQAKGLKKFNTDGPDKLQFTFNGELAEIIEITDNTIVVKVPESASSGATAVTVGDQVFFGPQFKVIGKIMIDPFFKAKAGADNDIVTATVLPDGRLLLGGEFTNYDNQASELAPTRRIVLTAADGEIDRTYRFGKGTNDRITAIIPSSNQQKLFLGGTFGAYDVMERFINNITTTLYNGTVDTISTPSFNGTVTVPAFNGGTNAAVIKLFPDGDKVIAVGNFSYYLSRRYAEPSKNNKPHPTLPDVFVHADTVYVDSVEMKQLIRFHADGSLDKSYHFDIAANRSLAGGNGSITHAMQQADGKLILVGNFSRWNGVPAGRIVRLNTDGSIDNTFNVGAGANAGISRISYSAVTHKFLLTGTFGSFNGVPVNNMVMLNEDGSVDQGFVARDFSNGYPNFVKQLQNGLIVVGGSFSKYRNVRRPGFIVLSPDGNLAPGYNATGDFSGIIHDAVERINSEGKISLFLLGGISKFDGTVVNNITCIAFE